MSNFSYNLQQAFGNYYYVKYRRDFYVLHQLEYQEFTEIPRSASQPTIDPYKFSVAKISQFRYRSYVTLTNYEFENPIGFKRDWTAFKEAIDEGLRLHQEYLDSIERPKEEKSRWEKVKELIS